MSVDTSASIATQRPARCQGFLADLLLSCAQGDRSALGRLFDVMQVSPPAEVLAA